MVTLVMQAAGPEASSAVVTASRGVSSETRRFLRPETRGWRHCVAPPTALGRRCQESLSIFDRAKASFSKSLQKNLPTD